jgi:hypothetical protein
MTDTSFTRSRKPLFLLASTLACLVVLAAAEATTYVAVGDGELADAAAAVAVVRVLDDGRPAPASALPSTRYLVEVERLLQGHLSGGRLELHVPGGVAPGGAGWKVHGAPELHRGERAIVFLEPRPDGAFGLVELMLGVFVERRRDGETLAVRDLSGAVEVGSRALGGSRAGGADTVSERRFDAFARWLEDRAAGVENDADYRVAVRPEAALRASDAFAVSDDKGQCAGSPLPIRWFDFDEGGSVEWRMHRSGQPGMSGSPPGLAAFQAAMAAWSGDLGSRVDLVFAGTTDATSLDEEGAGLILFADPDDEIAGSFDGSGVLAIGGPYFYCEPRTWRGGSYRPAVRGFIVTQDGAGSFFAGHGGADGEEIFTHELGHTLGFGHSTVEGALMRSHAHGDGRGARLGGDELAALAALYGEGEPPGGGGSGALPAPSALTGTIVTATEVRLEWTDNASGESGFEVEAEKGAGFVRVGTVAADATAVVVGDLEPGTLYHFRVRAAGAAGPSAWSDEVALRTSGELPAECSEPGVLCLQGGRFAVDVTWRSQHQGGRQGTGHAIPGSDESGYFWFFNSDNVELVVKALDGRRSNGHFWFFYGALTDVEYTIRVRDTQTGSTRTYSNQPGELCGRGDTVAFASAGLPDAGGGAPYLSGSGLAAAAPPAPAAEPTASGGCVPGPGVLCLQDGRFAVRVDWTNHHAGGKQGSGTVRPSEVGRDKTGFFWFFDPGNVELVVKMIDGREVNGRYWFFFGGLSDVEYSIEVHDTLSGEVRTYRNAPGSICGRGDTAAF